MIFRLVMCLLLFTSAAWAQAPPTETRTVDGSVSCLPSYLFQFPNGSLTCGTVAGKPAAIVNLGATPATLPWQNVTAGTSTGQNLTVGAGGAFRPAGGGIVEANRFTPAGTAGNCAEWTAGGVIGDAGGPCTAMGAQSLNDLNDVTLTNPLTGETLIKSGTDWLNGALDLGNTNAVTGTLPDIRVTDVLTIAASGAVNAGSLKTGTVAAGQNISVEGGLSPAAGGTIAASNMATAGTAGVCVEWGAGGTLVDAASGLACGDGGGSTAFSALTTGTNTQAAMTVGTGASMAASGTGTIAATTAAAAASTPTLCPAGQYARGVDGSFNATGCTTPGGGGLGANLSSTTFDILTDTGQLFLGGTGGTNNEGLLWNFESVANEVGVSSATGATTVNFGALNIVANNFTATAGGPNFSIRQATPLTAPTTTDEVASQFRNVSGNVTSFCWYGEGDSQERCVDGTASGGTPLQRYIYYDFAGCADGTTATSNFNASSGTTAANCETGGALRYATLSMTADNTCVQRQYSWTDQTDHTQPFNTVVRWKADSTGGTASFTMGLACWAAGVADTAVTFTTSTPVTPTTNGANQLNSTVFPAFDLTALGCDTSLIFALQVCKTTDALTGGTENDPRMIQLGFVNSRMIP